MIRFARISFSVMSSKPMPALLKVRDQCREIFRRLGFDADQDRAEIAGRFLQIFEAGDIVIRAQQVEEIAQRAGALRQRRMKYFFRPA